ncbi:MAG: BrnT family toxin [Caulobacterales bacterium]
MEPAGTRTAVFQVEGFDWDTAVTSEDARSDYGEPRYVAVGYVEALIYVVVFTPRGDDTRVISFRRANDREVKAYEDARSIQDR